MAARLLRRELDKVVEELKKVTKKTETYLYYNPDEHAPFIYILQESSIHLGKLLSRIEDKKCEILRLPEQFLQDMNLNQSLDSAFEAEMRAKYIISKLEENLQLLTSSSKSNIPKLESVLTKENPQNASPIVENSMIEKEVASEQILLCQSSVSPVQSRSHPPEVSSSKLEAEEECELVCTCDNILEDVQKCKNQLKQQVSPLKVEKQSPNKFELVRFVGVDETFPLFWQEFHRTVDKSCLEVKCKFAALRGLIRGAPYQLFLHLNYLSEKDYQEALNLLFEKYATDELKEKEVWKRSSELTSSSTDIKVSKNPSEPDANTHSQNWNDEYFIKKYCNKATKYEKPSRDLLVKVIHAFLNLYVFGSSKVSNVEYIWLILLHGVKFDDRYIMDSVDDNLFGEKEIAFPDIESDSQQNLVKYAPSFMKEKEEIRKYNLWKWKFVCSDSKNETIIMSNTVKKWYRYWWDAAMTADEKEFQRCVNHFALLSMVLLRATIKQSKSVEQYIATMFEESFYGFMNVAYSCVLPVTVPPHSHIYKVIRKTFMKSGLTYRKYLTYMVGCFAFCDSKLRARIRDFLNAGCMQIFSAVGTGSIYWLRKAAHKRNIKPEELLRYFTIDPAMENHVRKMVIFVQTYRKQVTYWWARLFEQNQLKEISTAYCPAFAFACYIIGTVKEGDVLKGRRFDQFSRFICNTDAPTVTGENLGLVIRNLISELQCMPRTPLLRPYRKIEEYKCKQFRGRPPPE